MRVRLVTLAAISAMLVTTAIGEDFWAKKPYHKWSQEETQKMLTNSPWAKTWTVGTAVNPDSVGNNAGVLGGGPRTNSGSFYGGDSAEGEMAPGIIYTVQIRSAAPIRQAMVRSQELVSRYDSMNNDGKAKFDASAGKFLAATFPDRILVCVAVTANVQGYVSQLRNYWAAQSVAKLSMTTFLDVGSEKLSLIGYGFKDDTIQFVFPRPKNIGADESLTVEFVHPTIQRLYEQRLLMTFKTSKMEINGQPSL